jgi:formamidopyrimidine-DNA glycosylase
VTLNRRICGPSPGAGAGAHRAGDQASAPRQYLLFRLSGGKTLLSHLGMTGAYRFEGLQVQVEPLPRAHSREKHDHLILDLATPSMESCGWSIMTRGASVSSICSATAEEPTLPASAPSRWQ